MPQYLLAHLYPHIKGSQEDVATLTLQYIVSQPSELKAGFTRILENSLHASFGAELNYTCQSVGEQQERPDISGVDANGNEVVLCEAKFYAGLTDNQPNGYLDRLQKENGIGLVFICPCARKVTLWSKLLDLCKDRNIAKIEDAEYCISVDGIKMSIITWKDVVDSLRGIAATEKLDALHDIDQLDGFCKMMDQEAFIPYSAEDFGPINAIREERHYQVIDALYQMLNTDKTLNPDAKGLRATAYRNGYVIYLRILGYALSLYYDRKHWCAQGKEETPFWLCIQKQDTRWYQPEEFRKVFNGYPESKRDMFYKNIGLALIAPTNATLEEVAVELKKQVLKYISDLETALKEE